MSGRGYSQDGTLRSRAAYSAASERTGDISAIPLLIESGEEPRRIFSAIVKSAMKTPGVTAAAIYLPREKDSLTQEAVAAGGENIPPPLPDEEDALDPPGDKGYWAADIVCLGAPIGCLAVSLSAELSDKSKQKLRLLAHHASVVFEKQKLSSTLQHFLDRLEVLNELNQLIASNTGLQRTVKSLARESAFRFAADVALAFLVDEDRECLEIKGGYGCAPNLIPARIPLDSGLLGQVMRVGGHLSIAGLQHHADHGLDFLIELGVKAVDACCLEVRGDSLGAILLGYRRDTAISSSDLTRFEEFAQGAAVAIANARTQERINAYAERLEELVNQRTADLAVQTAKAEEANKAKSRFLANMSHELRTPLTAIVGYSSVLMDGVFGVLSDKQKDALAAVVRSSDHLKKLIDDVLNLARIESGKEEVKPERVMLRDLLQQTHKLMLQQAISKKVELLPLKIPEEVLSSHLYADPKHVHQIIINLMSNAVKYTPSGGKVWVESELVGDKVKICISDTGVGIAPLKLEKLFERFERGEDTYSRSQEGTGIGLNLTRHLVELNGGRIGIESEVGKGSKFWILVPMATDQAPAMAARQELPDIEMRLDGLSVLVVDDNRDTCMVLQHVLLAAGAHPTTVNSVAEAISVLQKELPDIILTDLAIPEESGLVLIDHVRKSSGRLGRLPVLVLSACAFYKDQEAAMQAGASAFLPKPFKPSDIIRMVRQLTLSMAMQGETAIQ